MPHFVYAEIFAANFNAKIFKLIWQLVGSDIEDLKTITSWNYKLWNKKREKKTLCLPDSLFKGLEWPFKRCRLKPFLELNKRVQLGHELTDERAKWLTMWL